VVGILGNEVREFESFCYYYVEQKFCVGTGNGFDALVLIFKAYMQGKPKGDEVIVPANTYIASILHFAGRFVLF
jgi:dTDP-4-amino-4,6-dideoxygalactose transaminase